MSWTEVDLTEVSTEMETVPEASYVFELLPGAKYSKFDKQKIEVGAKIVEGDYAGRVIYFSYGDPAKVPTMLGAFKRLEIALAKGSGVAIEPNQDPVEYLNAVAGTKFIAPVRHRTYTNNEGETVPKVDIAVFKVKAMPEAA